MPTYEYLCEKCGHSFEVFQPITAEPLGTCTKERCARKRWGRGKVRRALGGGAGLIFKGTGFYITDYRSDNYKAAAKKESGAGTSTSGGETKSAPAKTESAGSKPTKSTTAT
jgi:putative FmdB family regulatory protein